MNRKEQVSIVFNLENIPEDYEDLQDVVLDVLNFGDIYESIKKELAEFGITFKGFEIKQYE